MKSQGISSFYGAVGSDEERFKVLDRAFELGDTFWDSAGRTLPPLSVIAAVT